MSKRDAFTPDHLTSKGILACPCGKGAGRAGEPCPMCRAVLGGPAKPVRKRAMSKKGSHEDSPIRQVPNTEPERNETPALDGAAAGEAQRDARPVVSFTGFRVRPLDPDNFAGSVKDLLDGLRHAGLIPGDEPWKIRLVTDQVRVPTFEEERTEVDITTERTV